MGFYLVKILSGLMIYGKFVLTLMPKLGWVWQKAIAVNRKLRFPVFFCSGTKQFIDAYEPNYATTFEQLRASVPPNAWRGAESQCRVAYSFNLHHANSKNCLPVFKQILRVSDAGRELRGPRPTPDWGHNGSIRGPLSFFGNGRGPRLCGCRDWFVLIWPIRKSPFLVVVHVPLLY